MSDLILHAIETGEPYPIKMMWFQSTNPIANMGAEAPRVYKALRTLDFGRRRRYLHDPDRHGLR